MNKSNDVRMLEAEAFRDGTQGIDPSAALEEIDKHFAQLQEQQMISTKDTLKSLEGDIEDITQKKFDTDRHWADLEMRSNGMPPPMFLCVLAVVFSSLVVVGETIFLAPVMDGFGIADPAWQHLLASVVVLVCSGLFEITKNRWHQFDLDETAIDESVRSRAVSRRTQILLLCFLNILTLPLVCILGYWRAEEMIFAAKIHSGSWQSFLSDNATLTRFVVVLLTVGLPVFVAMAFDWGVSGLRFAIDWRNTRRAYNHLNTALARTTKALEAEEEKEEGEQQALEEKRREWNQVYLQNHELGQTVGAHQLPLWQMNVKIVSLALLMIVVCILLDPIFRWVLVSTAERYFSYLFVVSSLTGLYTAYSARSRERPTPNQLYRQKAVIWRGNGVSPVSKSGSEPTKSDPTTLSDEKILFEY